MEVTVLPVGAVPDRYREQGDGHPAGSAGAGAGMAWFSDVYAADPGAALGRVLRAAVPAGLVREGAGRSGEPVPPLPPESDPAHLPSTPPQ
ncbi:hypothetical protein [Streptomyces sp. NPDC059611]|uniref:hypothetical protein n=1 Tax=Streptomyces sp. NPDC059611 TaxID=3346884 RepID=UPI0036A9EB7C